MAVSIHLIETAYVAVHNDLIHSIHVTLLRDLDRCMLTVFCTWQIICCHWPICSVVPVCLAECIQSVSHDNSHISSFLVSSSVPEGSVLGHIQTPTLMMLSVFCHHSVKLHVFADNRQMYAEWQARSERLPESGGPRNVVSFSLTTLVK